MHLLFYQSKSFSIIPKKYVLATAEKKYAKELPSAAELHKISILK